MQSAARVRSSPPAQGRGRGQDQSADSLLAQLFQPLLAPPPADASRAVTEPELAAVHPRSTPEISPELEWVARHRPQPGSGHPAPVPARPPRHGRHQDRAPAPGASAGVALHPPDTAPRTPLTDPSSLSSQATRCGTVRLGRRHARRRWAASPDRHDPVILHGHGYSHPDVANAGTCASARWRACIKTRATSTTTQYSS
jgi:hypothetical protein